MKRRLIFTLAIALLLVAILSLPAVAATEVPITASVTVDEFISITFTGSIAFGSLASGATDTGTTGQVDGSPAITIAVAPETNVNVDIGIKGELATGSLALTNWKYSTTFAGAKTSIPSAYGTAVYSDVAASSSNPFYHWITVPGGTDSGSHTITVSYKAVKTGTSF